ncbi:MAG: malate dehydrogenase [Candidatus Thermoplasmatota archaeon]
MVKISIVGAGRLGSTIAFSIAKERLATEMVLVDIIENLVMGEELDIGQTCIMPTVGTMDYSAIEGSEIVVVVAGIARKPDMTREQLLGTNIKIMKSVIAEVKKHAPEAKLLIVSNPVDPLTYVALRESGSKREMVFGMGGAVDSLRFRYFLGKEFEVPVEQVEGMVIGQHGEVMIPLTRSVKIRSKPIDQGKLKNAIAKTRDAGRAVIELKGATFYAPAHGTSLVVKAMVEDRKELIPSSVLLEEHKVCMGMPAIIGRNGVEKVLEPELTEEERAEFQAAVKAIRSSLEPFGY